MLQASDPYLDTWMGRKALAEGLISVIGRLHRETYRLVRRIIKDELLLDETASLSNTLAELELGTADNDIVRLNQRFNPASFPAALIVEETLPAFCRRRISLSHDSSKT